MKTISIKAKVIVVISTCLAIGAVAFIGLVRSSYNKNVQILSSAALTSAQRTFDSLKAEELSSLALASSGLANLQGVRDLFLKGDRDELYTYINPLYQDLKNKGVTVLTFTDKDGNAFLRMLNPTSFGDSLAKITTIRKAMETHQVAAGIDLAKPGLSAGSCRPFLDKDGSIIGYIVVGGTLDRFLGAMKAQSSDDYIMMGYKSFLDEKLYRNTRKAKSQPDTWDQFRNIVVLAKTIEPQTAYNYEADLQNLPAEGKLLGQDEVNEGTYVRGVFPLYDAAGRVIGGIFATHDITALHDGMKKVQSIVIVALVVLMLVLSVTIAMILNRLVFARLRRTMDVVTRVVGGEFTREIVPVSFDEVGHLEALFEQFRVVFVGVVDDLSHRQTEEQRKSQASGQ